MAAAPCSSLVFVDPSVKDIVPLICAAERHGHLLFLSAAQKGLDQVARHLARRARAPRIHLLADLSEGRLTLGSQTLDIRSLRDHAAMLARVGLMVREQGMMVIGAGTSQGGVDESFRIALEISVGVPVEIWDGAARRS
jgi:hypothetical protein